MKNLKVLGISVLVLLTAFSLIGCKDPDSDPESMTFVNEISGNEFMINEKFEFKAKVTGGIEVSGKIKGVSTSWKSDFTGTAYSMSSPNEFVNGMIAMLEMEITLNYVGDDVTVSFSSTNPMAITAAAMMAGTYTKK